MPSGAKKRKAAKKKKHKETRRLTINDNYDEHTANGNDDQISQDERESDNSSASHDHENHQDPSPDQSFVAVSESGKEIAGNTEDTKNAVLDDEATIKIEREPKPEENLKITDSGFEHEKSSSNGGGSSSSNSSSSDDESEEIKKKAGNEEADNSAFEGVAYNDADKPVESAVEIATQVNGNANVTSIPETVPVVDSAVTVGTFTEEQILMEVIPDETSAVPDEVILMPNKDEEKSLPKPNNEHMEGSSGLTHSDVNENERKTLPVSEPVLESDNVAKKVKESEVPKSSENEPPKELVHPVVKRTSWLSCCGLFDLMTGSGR